MKKAYLCKVVYTNEIAPDMIDFKFECADMAKEAKPGQFVHVKCGDDINTLLRRPISICDVEGDQMRIIFQIKGEGTKKLAQFKVGDMVDIMGPLGNGFDVKESGEKVAVIGGGIGTFPLLYLTKNLKNADVYLGFRSKELVTLEDEFSSYAKNLVIATDDGSYGYNGFAIDKLKENLEGVSMIYACGPTPMLKAVGALCKETGIKGQVSMEQRMGCGIGACLVCTCNINGFNSQVCKAGPVFNASEVVFDD